MPNGKEHKFTGERVQKSPLLEKASWAQPETIYRTPEQWQYWGAFFDPLLYLNLIRHETTLKSGEGAVYTHPRIQVRDSLGQVPLYIKGNHFPGQTWGRERNWGTAAVETALRFLEPLEPHLLTQGTLAGKMLDYLYFKSPLQGQRLGVEEREQEEQLFEEFMEEKKRIPEFRGNLTVPMIGGVIDAGRAVSITKTESTLEYRLVTKIYLPSEQLAQIIQGRYGGSFRPVEKGNPEIVPAYGQRWVGSGDDAKRILEEAKEHIVLLRRQADLGIQFQTLQPHLSKILTLNGPMGDLAKILYEYSGDFSLVDAIREGFYSNMQRSNQDV